jgi:3'-phosphoadenosine 5'-phosphosulfate sulfotransferase (PAPS reductase)/FAD synthetase
MQGLAAKQSSLAMDEAEPASNGEIAAVQTFDEEQTRLAAIEHCNELFASFSAEQRVEWALNNLPNQHTLSSSFGAQAAVSLHLVTSQRPDIPVVFVVKG